LIVSQSTTTDNDIALLTHSTTNKLNNENGEGGWMGQKRIERALTKTWFA